MKVEWQRPCKVYTMTRLFRVKSILIFVITTLILSTGYSQKKDIKFIQAKPMTGDQVTSIADQYKEQEERAKKERERYEFGAKLSRLEKYNSHLVNDIMKFGFSLISLISICLCFASTKQTKIHYFLPAILLTATYILYALVNSEKEEFSDFIENTIKVALIMLVLSSCLIAAFVSLNIKRDNLTEFQKAFAIGFSIIFTAVIAFVLTNNTSTEDLFETKAEFIKYPWNWLSFLVLNGFLFYNLKATKSKFQNIEDGKATDV